MASFLFKILGKVRGRIKCSECGKYRVIYGRHKLSAAQENLIKRAEEEVFYVCGTSAQELFPTKKVPFVLKEGQNCLSVIETTYYAGIVK